MRLTVDLAVRRGESRIRPLSDDRKDRPYKRCLELHLLYRRTDSQQET